MRSASGTKSGELSLVTFSTKSTIAFLGAVSLQEGSGSPCPCKLAPKPSRTAPMAAAGKIIPRVIRQSTASAPLYFVQRSLSPPDAPDAKSAVEIESSLAIQFRRHVLLLRYLLLDGELLVALVFWFVSDVGDAGFLVFINVEDLVLHGGSFNLIRRQRGVDLFLPIRLWSAHDKAGCTKERFGVGRSDRGAPSKREQNNARG